MALLLQLWNCYLRRPEDRLYVHIETTHILCLGHVQGWLVLVCGTGVVDDDVKLAELFHDHLNCLLPIRLRRYIHLAADSSLSNALRYFCSAIAIEVANEDLRSFFCKAT